MKLSVIVPVYNVLPYIRRCLDSILGQTIGDLELILIDDGSTDGTAQVLEEYAERYPDKVILKRVENGGQGRARNIAIEMARGEYLGFIDSDDWIDAEMYSKMYSRAVETGADVVVCDFLQKYDDGHENVLPACIQDHWLASAGSSCNKIFKREMIADVRFAERLWYEDFYFSAMMLLRSGRTEFIREPLYIYRQSDSSTMRNNNSARNLEILTIMDMLAEYMLPAGYRDEFEFFLINHVLLDSIKRVARHDAPDRTQVIAQLRAYVKKYIPRLTQCHSYQRESRNRRLIMYLNYIGLERLSIKILDVKEKL